MLHQFNSNWFQDCGWRRGSSGRKASEQDFKGHNCYGENCDVFFGWISTENKKKVNSLTLVALDRSAAFFNKFVNAKS